jgi:hypothetical protein
MSTSSATLCSPPPHPHPPIPAHRPLQQNRPAHLETGVRSCFGAQPLMLRSAIAVSAETAPRLPRCSGPPSGSLPRLARASRWIATGVGLQRAAVRPVSSSEASSQGSTRPACRHGACRPQRDTTPGRCHRCGGLCCSAQRPATACRPCGR